MNHTALRAGAYSHVSYLQPTMDMLNILFIATVIGALILALVSFLIYRKLGAGKVLSFLISLPTALYLTNAIWLTVIACDESISIKNSLKSSLNPRDFANIKPNRFVCPSEYSYTRNGKKEWVVYNDGAMFIDENHLP